MSGDPPICRTRQPGLSPENIPRPFQKRHKLFRRVLRYCVAADRQNGGDIPGSMQETSHKSNVPDPILSPPFPAKILPHGGSGGNSEAPGNCRGPFASCCAAGPERGGHAVPVRLDPFAILVNVDHGAAGPAQVVIRNGFRCAPGDLNGKNAIIITNAAGFVFLANFKLCHFYLCFVIMEAGRCKATGLPFGLVSGCLVRAGRSLFMP